MNIMNRSVDDPRTCLLADLNNEGAFHLERGHCDEAIQVFTAALKIASKKSESMKCCSLHSSFSYSGGDDDEAGSAVHSESLSSSNNDNLQRRSSPPSMVGSSKPHRRRGVTRPVDSGSSSANLAERRDSLIATTAEVQRVRTYDTNEETRSNFIYKVPMRTKDRYCLPTHIELSMHVVYNLALAHHLKLEGIKDDKSISDSKIRRVIKLYKLAHSIQRREGIQSEDVTHVIALINNVAQLYRKFGRQAKADKCLEYLLANLVCLIDRGMTDEVDQLDGFVSNVAHLIIQGHGASAA